MKEISMASARSLRQAQRGGLDALKFRPTMAPSRPSMERARVLIQRLGCGLGTSETSRIRTRGRRSGTATSAE
eukprot:1915160-Prymnesium_polylepis.1